MNLKKLKKWVYFHDKWFTYGITPLIGLLPLIFVWLYEKNYILLVRSDFLLVYTLICGLFLIVLIPFFYRMYLNLKLGKEFLDPYLLSLDKKKQVFCYIYTLSWFAAMTIVIILLIQANPDFHDTLKFMVIPPAGLFISLLVYILYLQKRKK